MAGLVGSSSSPISGIGIISVIVISLVLVTIGKSSGLFETADGQKFLTALTLFTASIVLTTATISNDNLQDLKTGLLVEATPWRQQVALIIGCFVGALVIAPVLENFIPRLWFHWRITTPRYGSCTSAFCTTSHHYDHHF